MAQRSPDALYLHIGLPKTGTTFLQNMLAVNRQLLAEDGILYPLPYAEAQFHAAVDLRGSHAHWGIDPGRVTGTWDRVARMAREHRGPAVVSHENLSGATAEQIDRAARSLAGRELHVVVSVRDIGRQVTAGWQEGIKSGGALSFQRFGDALLDDLERGRRRHRFWKMQDLPAVLDGWSALVPSERVHVVTCPRPGADPLELWRRFCAAIDAPTAARPAQAEVRANESLGVAAIALLREVNPGLAGRLDRAEYRHVVKRFLAQRLLPQHPSRRPALPGGPLRDRLEQLARDWVSFVRDAGYRVYGDLEEIVPLPASVEALSPDDVPWPERYDAATFAVTGLLEEVAALRRELERTRGRTPSGAARRLLLRARARRR